ncbi:MAG: Single-stranded DNA-binding protein [Bacteriophage sp.]|nr:MAG: Single-stranded DNA-binding protein [Bacteriophage sp.]
MTNYTTSIIESSKELSVREKIKLKDLTSAIAIDKVVEPEKPIDVAPDFYAYLSIHNEKLPENEQDYKIMVIVDKSGTKYYTGSESAISSFVDIFGEMIETAEPFEIEFYKKESKNYSGKHFITCSLV